MHNNRDIKQYYLTIYEPTVFNFKKIFNKHFIENFFHIINILLWNLHA